ncbi:hypothetical protein ABB02_00794 [Clostridiaceae bacterium JG1575]|nr:hypothetical protein ABB02_00794 [Clostridiaceae bacterium JG1575]
MTTKKTTDPQRSKISGKSKARLTGLALILIFLSGLGVKFGLFPGTGKSPKAPAQAQKTVTSPQTKSKETTIAKRTVRLRVKETTLYEGEEPRTKEQLKTLLQSLRPTDEVILTDDQAIKAHFEAVLQEIKASGVSYKVMD